MVDARALPPLAVALGDPAGVGPEVVAKSWEARERRRLPCFFAVGDERALSVIWRGPIVRIGTPAEEIGRAPCRERGGQYVEISVVAVYLKKKKNKKQTDMKKNKR